MSEYKYPAEAVFHQEEIKKSTFIVHIGHTPDLNAAKAFIKNIEDRDAPIRAAKTQKVVCALAADIFAIPKLM